VPTSPAIPKEVIKKLEKTLACTEDTKSSIIGRAEIENEIPHFFYRSKVLAGGIAGLLYQRS
jgi:hypothetical protein